MARLLLPPPLKLPPCPLPCPDVLGLTHLLLPLPPGPLGKKLQALGGELLTRMQLHQQEQRALLEHLERHHGKPPQAAQQPPHGQEPPSRWGGIGIGGGAADSQASPGQALANGGLANLASVAAVEYCKLYGQQVQQWLLQAVHGRQGTVDAEGRPWLLHHDQDALDTIKRAVAVERQLRGHVEACPITRKQLPGLGWRLQQQLQEALVDVVHTWRGSSEGYVQRLMEAVARDGQLWRPIHSSAAYCWTAVEVERWMATAGDVLMQLQEQLGGLRLPDQAVKLHLDSMATIMDDYAE